MPGWDRSIVAVSAEMRVRVMAFGAARFRESLTPVPTGPGTAAGIGPADGRSA